MSALCTPGRPMQEHKEFPHSIFLVEHIVIIDLNGVSASIYHQRTSRMGSLRKRPNDRVQPPRSRRRRCRLKQDVRHYDTDLFLFFHEPDQISVGVAHESCPEFVVGHLRSECGGPFVGGAPLKE